jgi:DNA-binding transcriptional regulator GbsR (MarR family)
MADEQEHAGVEAAEQAAAMLAAAGMVRMPARVLMALVGSPDEGYTAAELADRLGISPAAVSQAVRYLTGMRLIHRLSRPGDRRDRFQLADDAWHEMISANAPIYTGLAGAMERIADDNTDAPASAERAREMAELLRYLARRLPEMVDEWHAQRDGDGRAPGAG